MKLYGYTWSAALALCASFATGDAQALLRDDTGIEVAGTVDLDGRLRPSPPVSTENEFEISLPYTRSVVGISDSGTGFEYFSEADIGNQTLRIFGSLTNTTSADLVGDGLAIMNVRAQLRDTLTLVSALPGKQLVTLDMAIDGALSYASGIPIRPLVNAQLFFGPVGSATNDSNSYNLPGAIDDVLSVTIEVEGTTDVFIDALLSFAVFYARPGETITGSLDNTARLTLTLPTGVTLAASTSGTFGEVLAPVPLPGALPLLVSALLLPKLRRRGSA